MDSRLNRLSPGKLQCIPKSIAPHTEYIRICMKHESLSMHEAKPLLHVFRNSEEGCIEEMDEETSEEVHLCVSKCSKTISF